MPNYKYYIQVMLNKRNWSTIESFDNHDAALHYLKSYKVESFPIRITQHVITVVFFDANKKIK